MINPSANGWIDKYFLEQNLLFDYTTVDSLAFYKKIRATGFIYGHIISINDSSKTDFSSWNAEEISKVAFLNTLYTTFIFTKKQLHPEDFIKNIVAFYKEITPTGFDFFKKLLNHSSSSKLERLIDERVQTNKDIISRNFSHIVTNALLFADVLAFRHYLINDVIPDKYLKKIEETIMSIVALALQMKTQKSQHDDLLIKLFEASVRYTKFSKVNNQNPETLNLDYFKDDLEKYYLIDLAELTLWNDGEIENEEIYFLHQLAKNMHVSETFVTESCIDVNTFITNHRKEIQYFNYSNPVKHFYEQTTQSVIFLIKRNKKRLIQEISESKELMQLLAQSTKRDLDFEEKKKVKKQLLDICKSVPSLTIFLLPGGGLLLPILVKFIPQLLPSAFNENLEG